ncbi:MAG: carbamoyltransferase [Acidobacteriota bacterium]|nr:carbamoyltransferase [Acidobacteriota bacterium]
MARPTFVLGISAFFHESACCLLRDGKLVAAAEQERWSRVKHDSRLPVEAFHFCLARGGIGITELDCIAYYESPVKKLARQVWSGIPGGSPPDLPWLDPLQPERAIREGLGWEGPLRTFDHHLSHAASALLFSRFEEAAVFCADGVGEWATTSYGRGGPGGLELFEEVHFPHSLGLLYSTLTAYLGFAVNDGEYKVMGLAPYGHPRYAEEVRTLVRPGPRGQYTLDLRYFDFVRGSRMFSAGLCDLFGAPPRQPGEPISPHHQDVARSLQLVLEEILLEKVRYLHDRTGLTDLCMAGGVALNCVANGVLLRQGIFDDLWIQPASGDAGGALGAPLAVWHNAMGKPRAGNRRRDSMQGALLGPEFPAGQIREYLDFRALPYEELPAEEWPRRIAQLIAAGSVVGLCHGRMEFGPRALGNRSIVGDARSPRMQSIMNLKVKFRESFRPFAPSVLEERVGDYFELDRPSPYMLLVADVQKRRRVPRQGDEESLPLVEWVNRPRSDIPAVTHVDYSARIQTVSREDNPRYHALITEFERLTGYGVIVNTSFNVRGEPIVCTPEDAYRCFMRTEMDHLVLGPFLLDKEAQPAQAEGRDWRQDYQLD